jgi:hypothetical protein
MKSEEASISRQKLGKHIPSATNKQATIEKRVSKQRIVKHTTIRLLLETVISVRSVQSGYKEELVDCRDVSLLEYELGGRGIELRISPEVAVGRIIEMTERNELGCAKKDFMCDSK